MEGYIKALGEVKEIVNAQKIGAWALLPPDEFIAVNTVLNNVIHDINKLQEQQWNDSKELSQTNSITSRSDSQV
jgi:hypothetical protein